MENGTIENLLEWSINFGDLNQVRMYLTSAMQNNVKVKVEPAGKCALEGDEVLYKQSDLYFCQKFHTFCLPCLRNLFLENFLCHGSTIEYYCPLCVTLPLYTSEYKSTFIDTFFGDVVNNYGAPSPIMLENNYEQVYYDQNYYMQANYEQPYYGEYKYEVPKSADYILVDQYSQEFNEVTQNFYQTIKNVKVKNIYRVINSFLEDRFQSKKQEFFSLGLFCIVNVWHGTDNIETYKKICTNGFLIGGMNVKAKNGSAFGNGINTSLDASVCINYCRKSNHILLSEAVTGNETNDVNEKNPRFNTYRGNNVIIFFDSSQLMPRFLVEF